MCWVVVFSTAPAKVSLYAGEDHMKAFDVKAGVTKLSRSLRVGTGMSAKMERGGAVVAQCEAKDFVFNEKPSVYNFNAFVAMSA